jgi:hypothetical protein
MQLKLLPTRHSLALVTGQYLQCSLVKANNWSLPPIVLSQMKKLGMCHFSSWSNLLSLCSRAHIVRWCAAPSKLQKTKSSSCWWRPAALVPLFHLLWQFCETSRMLSQGVASTLTRFSQYVYFPSNCLLLTLDCRNTLVLYISALTRGLLPITMLLLPGWCTFIMRDMSWSSC